MPPITVIIQLALRCSEFTPTAESLSAALRIVLAPETGARAAAVAGTIRTDGAAVAAKLLLDVIGRERPLRSA